jgi:hypothetical protein
MNYYVLGSDGKEYGPCDFATLTTWARDNRLQPQSPVREAETGRSYKAVEVPGLFVPAAAPQMMPGQQPHNRLMTPMAQPFTPSTALLWAFLDPILGLIFFFFLHGIGVIFAIFGVIYAGRVLSAKHRLGVPALVFSVVCLGVIIVGWLYRGMNG